MQLLTLSLPLFQGPEFGNHQDGHSHVLCEQTEEERKNAGQMPPQIQQRDVVRPGHHELPDSPRLKNLQSRWQSDCVAAGREQGR